MKRFALAAVAVALTFGVAQAQTETNSMNKDMNSKGKSSPGTVGAMGNVNKDGIATDPGGVAQQSGTATKSSSGTVGAAPGAEVPSSDPKK